MPNSFVLKGGYFLHCKVVQKVEMYVFTLLVSKFMRQVYVLRIAKQINFLLLQKVVEEIKEMDAKDSLQSFTQIKHITFLAIFPTPKQKHFRFTIFDLSTLLRRTFIHSKHCVVFNKMWRIIFFLVLYI